jgi:hypothetical protein
VKPIIAAIYTKLSSATGTGSFHALVGGRYYHVEAPQNSAFPVCVYKLSDVINDDRFGGSRINRSLLTFTTYCEAKGGADLALDIDEALFTLLDQQTLAVSGSTYGNLNVQCIMRGAPYASEEFIILNSTYSLFSTRTA